MELYVKSQSKPETYLKVTSSDMKQNAERAQKASRMAMAIGRDADKNVLTEFVNDLEAPVFEAHHAKDIHRFFRAVSMSVNTRSSSNAPNQLHKIDLSKLPEKEMKKATLGLHSPVIYSYK